MPSTRSAPRRHENEEEHRRKIAIILDQVLIGKTNNVLDVTLTPDATETLVTRDRVCCDTNVSLTPKSASAAAALASGELWVESTKGQITIHHDSSSDTDRLFGATLVG
jgi:hypothetical protein